MKPFHLVTLVLVALCVGCGGATPGSFSAINNMTEDSGDAPLSKNLGQDAGTVPTDDSPSMSPSVDSGADVPTIGNDSGPDVATDDPPDAAPSPVVDASPAPDGGTDGDGGNYCFTYPTPVPQVFIDNGLQCQMTSNPGLATCCCPFPANTHTYSSRAINDACNPN